MYQLAANPAVLMCRVRGLHLSEKHVSWRGEVIPRGLFTFALYFLLIKTGIYWPKAAALTFISRKTESWQEIAWWREIPSFNADHFDLPRGT